RPARRAGPRRHRRRRLRALASGADGPRREARRVAAPRRSNAARDPRSRRRGRPSHAIPRSRATQRPRSRRVADVARARRDRERVRRAAPRESLAALSESERLQVPRGRSRGGAHVPRPRDRSERARRPARAAHSRRAAHALAAAPARAPPALPPAGLLAQRLLDALPTLSPSRRPGAYRDLLAIPGLAQRLTESAAIDIVHRLPDEARPNGAAIDLIRVAPLTKSDRSFRELSAEAAKLPRADAKTCLLEILGQYGIDSALKSL